MTRLRERAEAGGVTIAAHLEELVTADEGAEEKLESLALEGLQSGQPIDHRFLVAAHGTFALLLI